MLFFTNFAESMSCRRIVTADPTILGGLSAIRQLDYESANVASMSVWRVS
jgi:hypothetical protein